jgi:hypothetical protein
VADLTGLESYARGKWKTAVKTPTPAQSQRAAEPSSFQNFSFTLPPPSGLTQRLFQEPPAKANP